MRRAVQMDGCGRFIQILMFLSNFIIWIGSIILLVLGIWAVVDRPYLEVVLGESVYISAAYILISVGVLIFILSFLGCFGAIKEIKCMLLLYFILVLILFIILLVGGILGLVFHQQAAEKIRMGMLQSMKEYQDGDSAVPVTKSWDEAQSAMKCCGITSEVDWRANNAFFKTGAKSVPRSCCKRNPANDETLDCTENPTAVNTYTTGCYEASKEFVTKHSIYIGIAGISVASFMLCGLVFAIILFKLIK